MFLQLFPSDSCCLCGNGQKLTGEHKIKASALRKAFGKDALSIGVLGSADRKLKSAQSTGSKHLKFNVRICEACNTHRTQAADLEFDRLHQFVLEAIGSNNQPDSVFDLERYEEKSPPYLNVFRYFTKLLCCHIAEVNGPIPKKLAEFAMGQHDFNRIWLKIKLDPTYEAMMAFEELHEFVGEHKYAAHGGLVVIGNESGEAKGFHSPLTIGAIQYVFYVRMGLIAAP